MNLTSLFSQEYRGVNPGGVVDTELELYWQRVVTFVVGSANVKRSDDSVSPVSLLLAANSWTR
jgi:hypothetical protein